MPQTRILVAESNRLDAQSIRQQLEQAGYAVEMALDGHRALDLAGAIDFELILSAVWLPDMDGSELSGS